MANHEESPEESSSSEDEDWGERSGEALAGLADDDAQHFHPVPPWLADLEPDHGFGEDGRINEAMGGMRQANDCWY